MANVHPCPRCGATCGPDGRCMLGAVDREIELADESERLRGELKRVSKLWGQLHTACSELVSLVETVGDMEDEQGQPFWEPEFANAMRWLHYYPEHLSGAEKAKEE